MKTEDTCNTRIGSRGNNGDIGDNGDNPLSTIFAIHDPATAELAAEREAIQWGESATDEEFQAALDRFDAEPWE